MFVKNIQKISSCFGCFTLNKRSPNNKSSIQDFNILTFILHDIEITFAILSVYPLTMRRAPVYIYKSSSLRSAEYGRTSPDSTNRKMHKFDTTARRHGANPADPLGFGRRYSRRVCTYLYLFSFSLYYSHPCIRLIHLWHPHNHLTAYLPIAFNLTPSVVRFLFSSLFYTVNSQACCDL